VNVVDLGGRRSASFAFVQIPLEYMLALLPGEPALFTRVTTSRKHKQPCAYCRLNVAVFDTPISKRPSKVADELRQLSAEFSAE